MNPAAWVILGVCVVLCGLALAWAVRKTGA